MAARPSAITRASVMINQSRPAPGNIRCKRSLGLAAGCLLMRGGGGGPQAVEVAGKVTFDGKPVPAGRIYFNPDFSKGNDGPQGYTQIRQGEFDTRQGGKGACGGPTVVVIQGYEAGSPDKP